MNPQVSDGEWKGSVVVPNETRDEIYLRRLREESQPAQVEPECTHQKCAECM